MITRSSSGVSRVSRAFGRLLPLVLAAAVSAQDTRPSAEAPAELDDYDVVFTTPSDDERGNMPLGNGLVGVNAWAEPDGSIVFYIGRMDAHSETQRLLKLGRVRVRFEPNPWPDGAPFTQRLRLRDGRLEIEAGDGDAAVRFFLFVDSERPIIHLAGHSRLPRAATATVEIWRTERRDLKGEDRKGSWILRDAPADVPTWESADVVLDDADGVTWAHRNAWSATAMHVELQGVGGRADSIVKDPLKDRTFGARLFGPGWSKSGPTTLTTTKPATRFDLSAATHSAATPSIEAWRAELRDVASRANSEAAYARSSRYWREFWARSWIFIGPEADARGTAPPLELGTGFSGAVGRLGVFATAVDEEIAAELAARPFDAPVLLPPAAASYVRLPSSDTAPLPAAPPKGVHRGEGGIAQSTVDGLTLRGPRAASRGSESPIESKAVTNLSGEGLRFHGPVERLVAGRAFTCEAWIRPTSRTWSIFRGVALGGFSVDYSDGSLGFTAGGRKAVAQASIPIKKWTHVAASFDGVGGRIALFIDGREVASERIDAIPPSRLTERYLLARYVAAAQARGPRPILFQGGMFNVAAGATRNRFGLKGPADDRSWGQSVWWQNVRHIYHPMLAQGDVALMKPLFDFYFDHAPLFRDQARRIYGAEGLFVFETTSLFGLPGMGDFGWGQTPPGAFQEPYTRNMWQQPLEIACLALDAWEHGAGDAFLKDRVLPWADDALRFFATRFARDAEGRLLITPSHAAETYWDDVVNDLPSVAGLHALTARLLALPTTLTTPEARSRWAKLRDELPPIPRRRSGDTDVFAAAEKHETTRRNSEQPELYGVFPFRLFGLGSSLGDLRAAQTTFAAAADHRHACWHQTGLFAALLGLSDRAAADVLDRAALKMPEFRFPGYHDTPYDWPPDMDGAGAFQHALQLMLLQSEGDAIRLRPAWPASWNARFKLHGARGATVEAEIKDGRVTSLVVDPPSRGKSVR